MKIIKKIALILIVVLMIVIYITNRDTKIYYVSLGDGLSKGIDTNNNIGYGYSDYTKDYLKEIDKLEFYTKGFSNIDNRTTDIINNIKNNVEIIENDKTITIKQALMKADLITLSTGLNEILYKLTNENISDYEMYKYIDELLIDIDNLIDLVKRYCKEDIIILGFYNPFVNRNYKQNENINNVIMYANNKLKKEAEEEKIIYVDLYNLFKNNSKVFTSINSYYPNTDGYKLINSKIIDIIEKTILKNDNAIR